MRWLTVSALLLLGACTHIAEITEVQDGAPANPEINPWSVAEPVPRVEPLSRYGNPPEYTVHGKTYRTLRSSRGYTARGRASWYGTKFHGQRTSSGEPYDMYAITAAHRSLPLPCYVEVTNLENGRRLVVRVNDRGPFHPDRILDLSYAAAVQLGVFDAGSAEVEIVAIDPQVPQELVADSPQPAGGAVAPSLAARYFLQLGAFRHVENRDGLLQELASRGVSGLLERTATDAAGRVLHRVWTGPYTSRAEAEDARANLGRLGYATTLIQE